MPAHGLDRSSRLLDLGGALHLYCAKEIEESLGFITVAQGLGPAGEPIVDVVDPAFDEHPRAPRHVKVPLPVSLSEKCQNVGPGTSW